jgi:ABC-type sugar transport system permease subunit
MAETRTAPRRRYDTVAYLFVLPAFLLYAAFFLWPFVQLIELSTYKWDGLQPREFVGLENYRELLTADPIFWQAFQHNVMWLLSAIVVPVGVGLLLALLLVRTKLHARTVFRTIYFLPQVLATVIVAIIWRWVYNPSFGLLNTILERVGLETLTRGWLGGSDTALAALFVAWSWVHYGFCMVIFIAALQNIDEVYFDAARVDGAGWYSQLRHIIFPFIQGPLTTIVLITAIAAFQVFDLVFIITQGGPSRATLVLSVYMYDTAFRFARIGYGAAIAVVLGVIILVFSIAILRVRGALNENVV